METFEFNPGVDYVSLRLRCPKCGEEFTSDAMSVPSPNWAAETHSDSIEFDEYEIQCVHCGECFNVSLYNGFYGGEGEIDTEDEKSVLEVIEEYPDDYEFDKDLFDISHADISNILDAIEPLSEPIKEKLYKLLYVQLIINLEAYLGDTLKYYVRNDKECMRKFVEGYTPYRKEMLKFSDIYRKFDKIKEIVNNTLNELLYHKLYLMRILYKAILDVDFGDIDELSKAVQMRHNIVHRDGKDTEGVEHSISKDDVVDLSAKTKAFIDNINRQLPLVSEINIDELF